jgi:hypothetical protein
MLLAIFLSLYNYYVCTNYHGNAWSLPCMLDNPQTLASPHMFEAYGMVLKARLSPDEKQGHPVYIGSYGEQGVVLMAAEPPKNTIKFGTSAGKFKYTDDALMGIDKDIQELFYAEGKE